MSIELQKQKAGIHLQKKGVDLSALPNVRVGLALDISGSMRQEYRDGHVQDAVTHLLALASHMDRTEKMDVFTFDSDHAQVDTPATPKNYMGYVQRYILDNPAISKWGGTNYAGVIRQMYQHYFPEDSRIHMHRHLQAEHASGFLSGLFHHHHQDVARTASREPILALFLTDGEASDERHAREAVEDGRNHPIFWVFVGLAHESRYLRDMGREPNGEFVLLEDGIRISDDQLYSSLITGKLTNWLNRL